MRNGGGGKERIFLLPRRIGEKCSKGRKNKKRKKKQAQGPPRLVGFTHKEKPRPEQGREGKKKGHSFPAPTLAKKYGWFAQERRGVSLLKKKKKQKPDG